MSLILIQETASSIPTPPAGKGTLFLNSTNGLVVKDSANGTSTIPTSTSATNTQVFFNDAGGLGQSANFVFNSTSSTLTVSNLTVSGTLSAGDITVSSIANGTSNVDIIGVGGNVTTSVAGNANIFVVTGTGANVNGTFSASGNANVANLGTTGIYATTLSATANANVGNLGTAGLITATGNVTAGNLTTAGLITATGNVTAGNLSTAGVITASGNITGGNIITAGIMSSTGNATHGNVLTGGIVSATGNITGGNIITTGTLSVTGNINGGNLVTSNVVSATGNGTFGNVYSANIVSATGNVVGANLVATGLITATGNVTANNAIIGNVAYVGAGANTTAFTAPTIIAKSTGAQYIQAALVNGTATGSADWVAYGDNGNDVAGWNDWGFTGSNFSDANYTITGKNDGYMFVQPVNGAGLGGNLVFATGSQGANRDIVFATGGFLVANEKMRYSDSKGQFQVQPTTVSTNTTTGALIVGGGVGIAGNIYSGGIVSATGTLTAGNLATAGTLSVTGNANVGNISATLYIGNLSSTGNSNVGNLGVTGVFATTLSATGNANVGNIGAAAGAYTANVSANNLTATNRVTAGNGLTVTTGGATITGNIDVTGNFNVTGNLNYSNVTDLVVGDPLIYLGANNTGNVYDMGIVASYNDGSYKHTGLARNHNNGYWTFFDGVVTEPTTVIDWANATYPTVKTGPLVSTSTISATGNANVGNLGVTGVFATTLSVTGNANVGNIGATNIVGTLTTAAQTNITSVGTLGSLAVTGNVSAANVTATHYGAATGLTSIPGANVTGTLSVPTTSYSSTVSGAAQANITSVGTLTGLTVSGTTTISGNAALTTTNLTTGANTTAGYITGNWTLTTGSKLTATYADLSEKYVADDDYESGTVLVFGGLHEVTISTEFDSFRVAGVVTTNAAYTMNSELEAEFVADIALQGRVPCKVLGPVYKGDLMVSAGNGYAIANNIARAGTIIGKSLENFANAVGVIEVAVGRF